MTAALFYVSCMASYLKWNKKLYHTVPIFLCFSLMGTEIHFGFYHVSKRR